MKPYLSHLKINDTPKPQTTNTNIKSLLYYKHALSQAHKRKELNFIFAASPVYSHYMYVHIPPVLY